MRVAFVAPDLRKLDGVKSNALCLCLHEDEWPLRGTPGLVDWRVSGHLSRLAEKRWITSSAGEVVLMPIAGRLPFDKLLLVGMGPFGGEGGKGRVEAGLHRMFDALLGLRVHAAVLHLPGRPGRLPAEEAIRTLLAVAESHAEHDELVLVEPLEAQREMKAVLDER